MPREITLEKAEERAFEVEIISRLLDSYPHILQDSELSAITGLLSRLSGEVSCFFIEEQAERREKNG